jgi:imidazolonepropionase-like amidohydrolase
MDRAQYSVEELSEVVNEAKLAGKQVAAHTGGLEGIHRAISAGVASIEHGSYADEAAMLALKEKNIVWVPTNAPAVRILQNQPSADFPATYLNAVRETWHVRRAAVQRGIELGVRFAAGTDAGVPSTPHGNVALEVKLFRDLGMPAMQTIWTATRWASELLGLSNKLGTIAPGKLADLILVANNPLDDLNHLSEPQVVFKNGVIFFSKGEIG